MAYSVVGKSLPKIDSRDKVTGRAQYAADISLPGMLVGKILRSPHPHARILAVDTTEAERLPGVRAVLTGANIPTARIGNQIKDQPILARDKVRFAGEPVAVVAAVDEATADAALSLIRVEYQELPVVTDPLAALEPEAPTIHEDLDSYEATLVPLGRRDGRPAPPNLLNRSRIQRGDVEKAFAQADLVVEARYRTQVVHPACLEPHACVAQVSPQGKVTVWTSTQGPFIIRNAIAHALSLPLSRVRVIGTVVGGGFGGKSSPFIEPMSVLLAQRTGRPVKIVLSRQEDFTGTSARHAAIIDLKTGITRDGQLLAVKGRVVFDTGAYADSGVMMARRCFNLQGPYNVPNVELEDAVAYTNNTMHGSMRAPASPQTLFAIESQMDIMARVLGLDPIEFRLKNAVREGDSGPEGGTLYNVGLEKTLLEAKRFVNQVPKPSGRFVGRGVACGQRSTGPGGQRASACCLKVEEDGTAVLFTGGMELGGGLNTVLAQIVAEGLGIPMEKVVLVAADTDLTPMEGGSTGSTATYRVGATVKLAVDEARGELQRLAAERLEANPDDLEIANGQVFVRGSSQKSIPMAALAKAAMTSGRGPLLATGASLKEGRAALLKERPGMIDAPAYTTHVVDLEVDPLTGKVAILNYLAVHDVGFALNPQGAEGQIQGAVVFGLGYALTEEMVADGGHVLNPNFTNYRLFTAPDVPPLQWAMLEEPSDLGPYGAKGIGEPPLVPVAAALANALHDALGIRFREMPFTPEKIATAWQQRMRPRGGTEEVSHA